MRKLFTVAAFLLAAATILPTAADARVFVGVNVGGGGYYPGMYSGYYPYPGYAYPPVAYAAPPVVYAPPPVVYTAPPVVVAPPAPQPVYVAQPTATPAEQTSPTFVDQAGRQCRLFETATGATGTACLLPDGTWRTVAGN